MRFTSKMLPHLEHGQLADGADPQKITSAFRALADAACRHREQVRLAPGQLLVFDQLRWAHGRMPLGDGQAQIPSARRRLLRQTYVQGSAQ